MNKLEQMQQYNALWQLGIKRFNEILDANPEKYGEALLLHLKSIGKENNATEADVVFFNDNMIAEYARMDEESYNKILKIIKRNPHEELSNEMRNFITDISKKIQSKNNKMKSAHLN